MGLIDRGCLFGNAWRGSRVFPKRKPRSIPSIRAAGNVNSTEKRVRFHRSANKRRPRRPRGEKGRPLSPGRLTKVVRVARVSNEGRPLSPDRQTSIARVARADDLVCPLLGIHLGGSTSCVLFIYLFFILLLVL
jgi:hypothetical protein